MAKIFDPRPGIAYPPPIPPSRGGFRRVPIADQQRLVQDNLAFAIKVACEYRNLGLPIEDLIGEGSVGLMQAAARYDPGRGTKFVTYASAWVRKSILRALSQSTRTIRIPAYHLDKLKHYQRAEALLREQLGRRPARDEISRQLSTTAARLDALLESRIFEVSLDILDGESPREPRIRTLPDPSAPDPERDLLRDESQWLVEEALAILAPRERRIIMARFGLGGEPRASLRELADSMGLSRERVRQIEDRAKQKIRRHLGKKLLCRRVPGATIHAAASCARHEASPRPERGGEDGPA